MIPIFPKFTKLRLEHFQEIQKISSKFAPYSDFNFTCLWSYYINNNIKISLLNGNLVVNSFDYLNGKPFYSFFGAKFLEDTCNKLFEIATKNKIDSELKLIPEIFVDQIKKSKNNFNFEEDRDNFDYVYLLKKISTLPGNKYRSKRQLFKKFCAKYPHHKIKYLDIKKKENADQILSLFLKWEKVKNKNRKDTNDELQALKKLLKEAHFINLLTLGIYIDDELSAFSINEKIDKNYALAHFGKSDHTHQGLNESLYKFTADFLIKEGCKFWNIECDLGIENLRNSKMSWRPEYFLKKYTITKAKQI